MLKRAAVSNQTAGLFVQPLYWLASALKILTLVHRLGRQFWKHSFLVIVALPGHHVPGCFGQFARQRFGRDDLVGFGRLAVVPAPTIDVIAPREVGRFNKGPTQILVATLLVVVRF